MARPETVPLRSLASSMTSRLWRVISPIRSKPPATASSAMSKTSPVTSPSEFLGVLLPRKALAHHSLAGANEPPQRRFLLDDPGVVLDVRDVGDRVEERGEVRRAARLFDGPRAVEIFLQREDVDLRRPLREIHHRAIDPPMRVGEEVVLAQDREDRCERRGLEEDRAENGSLRFEVLGETSLRRDFFEHRGVGSHSSRRFRGCQRPNNFRIHDAPAFQRRAERKNFFSAEPALFHRECARGRDR